MNLATGSTAGPRSAAARRGRLAPLAYLAPALLLACVWVYLPVAATLGLSVMDWNLTGPLGPFVGLDNYQALLTDEAFTTAVRNTLVVVLGLVPLVIVLPLVVAIGVWKYAGRLGGLYRTLLFLPVILSPAAGAIMWQWMLHPLIGVVNTTIGGVGLAPVNWLGSPATALWVVITVTGWKSFGLSFLLYTGGLASIDRRHLDAARVDGATELQVTRHILVPLLAPTIALVGFTCLVLGPQWTFTAVDVLTQGGPDGATDNVFYLLYRYAFSFFDTGMASATGVILLAAFGVLASLQLRVGGRGATHAR